MDQLLLPVIPEPLIRDDVWREVLLTGLPPWSTGRGISITQRDQLGHGHGRALISREETR
ncbi:MAG: hypothetical protein M3332_17360 [Actinomycetota bacterium]|nr:hypothetical protein [Actinomycetota bacterium]